jgi:hypothetical protein
MKGVQRDGEVAVRMIHGRDLGPGFHLDPQLLIHLPHHRCLQRLTRLSLAARKLPEAAQRSIARPFRDEDLVATPDDRDGDVVVRALACSAHPRPRLHRAPGPRQTEHLHRACLAVW